MTEFTLTVAGTNFANGALVLWNNGGAITELRPSATIATSLTVAIPLGLAAGVGTVQISVRNPNTLTSNAWPLSIVAPPLVVSGISQNSVDTGSPQLTLTITGAGFLAPAVVSWNGQPLPTTLVTTSQVRAVVGAALLAFPGSASIVLSSAGRSSAPIPFTIVSRTPPIYTNAIMTKSAPPETACARPTASTVFSTSDGPVQLYFEALVLLSHKLTSDWLAPDGTVIPGGSWAPKEGLTCFTAALPVDSLPANRLGTWQARAYESGNRLFSLSFTVAAADPTMPAIASGEVRNGAGFQRTVAPGAWFQIKGANFSTKTRTWKAEEIVDGRLPAELDGVSVTIGGRAAFIYYVSPAQINAVAPADLAAGPAAVVVTNNGKSSAPAMVTVEPFSPAFFTYGSNWIIATDADYRLIGNPDATPGSVAARPGDVVVFWGTGFGPSIPPVASGTVTVGAPAAAILPGITIGGANAQVAAAVMSPASAGVYQIAVTIPPLPDGDHEVLANSAGYRSPAGFTIHVRSR